MIRLRVDNMLKADFHMHTKEDPYDWFITYTAKDLIRLAAKKKFDVLSITLHNRVLFSNSLKDFAKKRGILLIPGAEPMIEKKDVLLVNVTNEQLSRIKKLKDLDKIRDSALVVAPHPFFLTGNCLEGKLIDNIKRFDAIEFSHFYTRALINPFFKFIAGNAKALAVAEKYKKPVIGTSDAHKLYEFGTTYTTLDCEKRKEDILEAVRKNKIKLETKPMPVHLFISRIMTGIFKEGLVGKALMKRKMLGLEKDLFFKRFKNSPTNKKIYGRTAKARQ